MAMVAYTELSRDARIQKAVKVAIESGLEVDCYMLNDKGSFQIQGMRKFHIGINQYRGNSNRAYIFSYLHFFLKVFFVLSFHFFRRKYKIIHCHNMPDFLIFTGLIPKIFGAKLILDIHDSMPEVYATKFKKKSKILKLLTFEERVSSWFANRVITVHEPYRDDILAGHGLNTNKIDVILNVADDELFAPKKFSPITEGEKIKFIFHGTIADRFGLGLVIEGLREVQKTHSNFEFNIYGKGDGEEDLKSQIKENNLEEYVFLKGFVPLNELPEIIADCHIGIVPQKPLKGTDYMLPVKLLEYLSIGLPVISVQNSVVKYYMKDVSLMFYDPADIDSFVGKVLEVMENPKLINSQREVVETVREKFSWSNEKLKLLEIYDKLL